MIAYYKLLDYLNRNKISKEKFRKMIGIAPSTMAKISKNEPISLSVIDRICYELKCQPGDIIEHIEQEYTDDTSGISVKIQTSWAFDEFDQPQHGISEKIDNEEEKKKFFEFVEQKTHKKEIQPKEILKQLYDEYQKTKTNN